VTLLAHFNFHLLLVFVDDVNRETEADDGKVDMLAIDRNGYDPASLTTALVTYATGARPSQAFGFPHRRHRIVGKKA